MLESLNQSTWKALGIIPNTSNLSFHVLQSFLLNIKVSITHVFHIFSLNTNINTHVLEIFLLNTNI